MTQPFRLCAALVLLLPAICLISMRTQNVQAVDAASAAQKSGDASSIGATAALPDSELAPLFAKRVRPLLAEYCLGCHSTKEKKGELDLERFVSIDVARNDLKPWQSLIEMLDAGEMPPKGKRQPTADERKWLIEWTRRWLDLEARSRIGDPGRSPAAAAQQCRIQLHGARSDRRRSSAGPRISGRRRRRRRIYQCRRSAVDVRRHWSINIWLRPRASPIMPSCSPTVFVFPLVAPARLDRRIARGDARLLQSIRRWRRSNSARALPCGDNPTPRGDRGRQRIVHRNRPPRKSQPKVSRNFVEHAQRFAAIAGARQISASRWKMASVGDAAAIAAGIDAWQKTAWTLNERAAGIFEPYQMPNRVVTDKQEFRRQDKCSAAGPEGNHAVSRGSNDWRQSDISKHKIAGEHPLVIWDKPRFEADKQPPLPLADVSVVAEAMNGALGDAFRDTTKYLAAAAEWHRGGGGRLGRSGCQKTFARRETASAWIEVAGVSREAPGAWNCST